VEQALELSLQVLQHPSVSQPTKGRFERLRSELEGQLLPSQIEAAQKRALGKSLEDVVEEALGSGLYRAAGHGCERLSST
ncbi:MAG: hypothetical protein KIT87_25630, partial [Anaerolineae bacterium]|nr:hypothetical protein [Anaerolineae bacterium]